jgi:hypothetical protein
MRPIRLARIAAEAEGVRLRALLTRVVSRIILGVIALFFVLGACVFVHIAAWMEIRGGLDQSDLTTAGILGGADLVVAIILGLLSGRSRPSQVELDAYEVRRSAIAGIGSAISLTQIAFPLLRIIANFQRSRRR